MQINTNYMFYPKNMKEVHALVKGLDTFQIANCIFDYHNHGNANYTWIIVDSKTENLIKRFGDYSGYMDVIKYSEALLFLNDLRGFGTTENDCGCHTFEENKDTEIEGCLHTFFWSILSEMRGWK